MTQLELCNLALSKIGEPPIDAFADTRAAAATVRAQYQPTLNALVRKYRWNFARKSVVLAPVFYDMDDLIDDGNGLIQVEANIHGLQTGGRVVLKDTGADGMYTVTRIDAHNFTCDDSVFTSSLTVGSFHIAPVHTWEHKILLPDECIALRTVNGYEANRAPEFYTREGDYFLTNNDELDVVYTRKMVGGTDEGEFDTTFDEVFTTLLAANIAMGVTGAIARRNAMMEMYDREITDALMSNVFERRDPDIDKRNGPTSYVARQYP
jgi:hypothetical protein